MIIYISDEAGRLSEETALLMDKAAETAMEIELGDSFGEQKAGDLPVELSVTIVDRDEIQELNKEYRGIDKVTDVLSFPQFADEEELISDISEFGVEGNEVMLGDVVICYDRALEQAEEYGTGIRRELIYLFVHSIFHLFGYDHETEEDKSEMRSREEAVMDAIAIPKRVD